MSNSADHLVEETLPLSRGIDRDSQSPQAHRGGSDDTEALRGDRSVQMSDRRITKTDDANPHAWENADRLRIEDINKRADRTR